MAFDSTAIFRPTAPTLLGQWGFEYSVSKTLTTPVLTSDIVFSYEFNFNVNIEKPYLFNGFDFNPTVQLPTLSAELLNDWSVLTTLALPVLIANYNTGLSYNVEQIIVKPYLNSLGLTGTLYDLTKSLKLPKVTSTFAFLVIYNFSKISYIPEFTCSMYQTTDFDCVKRFYKITLTSFLNTDGASTAGTTPQTFL